MNIQKIVTLYIAVGFTPGVVGLIPTAHRNWGQDPKAVLAAVNSGFEEVQDFQTVFDFIRASDNEGKWREIGWIPSLWSGRQAANEKQKPLFVWAMNGDPLGCV